MLAEASQAASGPSVSIGPLAPAPRRRAKIDWAAYALIACFAVPFLLFNVVPDALVDLPFEEPVSLRDSKAED